MKNNRTKKDNPRLFSGDVYRVIAQQTSLTQEQARECFNAYAQFVKTLAFSDNKPKYLEIPLPKLGSFIFKVKEGRKKGSTYMIPIERGSKILKKVVLEEDEPNYDRLTFKVRTTIQEEIKSNAKNKNNNIDFNELKKNI